MTDDPTDRRTQDVATARSMAEIIDAHALEASGGLTYAELGRYLAADGDPAGTSDESAAVVGAVARCDVRLWEASAVRMTIGA